MLHTIQAASNDESFLYQLYATTREAEMAAWGWDASAVNVFLQMQWNAQKRSYDLQYPDASHNIILYNDLRVGRMMYANTTEETILIDISLLPEFRNQGIGTRMIRTLQFEQGLQTTKPIRLSVLKHNPAKRLYERLGFTINGGNGLYENMLWFNELVEPDLAFLQK
ncbi:Ribosomal protein S18 acetylase RimI [Paenibacillus sp. 1_12]|uniref:GNAT family N-acetyltransferase n=1 Tax=Paenibacillus sp. 1_12 TaxID=1566278 RepID=UPI0008EC2498|nr:GNAT family N-acetyltransferase [Paenibacillus sp. 1_12]SFL21206.1 Ribosomal protein S18 acetylase RimI [Paenibacillus sp. 1_12]